MVVGPSDTTRRLAVLRMALDALAERSAHLPDPVALRALLEALDPALSGTLLGPALWHADTGLPDPQWVARLAAFRAALPEQPPEGVPANVVIHAAGSDPSVATRMLQRSVLDRFLRRAPAFPAPPMALAAGVGWRWDAVLQDGRWGRLAAEGPVPTTPSLQLFEVPFGALEAALGSPPIARAVVGPVVRDASGMLVGLHARVEVPGEAPWHRVAVDRMQAEAIEVSGAVVVPLALPSPDEP